MQKLTKQLRALAFNFIAYNGPKISEGTNRVLSIVYNFFEKNLKK